MRYSIVGYMYVVQDDSIEPLQVFENILDDDKEDALKTLQYIHDKKLFDAVELKPYFPTDPIWQYNMFGVIGYEIVN